MKPTAFRVRATHYTSGKPFTAADKNPWRVLCESHCAGLNSCARYAVEPLDGDWSCQECAHFTHTKRVELEAALRSPDFSHATRRGHDREIGVVYHRDRKSPTGVRAAGGFDPYCPEAAELVRKLSGTPHDGPQSGSKPGARSPF